MERAKNKATLLSQEPDVVVLELGQRLTETNDTKEILGDFFRNLSREATDVPLLAMLEKGVVSDEDWKRYFKQRLAVADDAQDADLSIPSALENVLQHASEVSFMLGVHDLGAAYEKNLNDERGLAEKAGSGLVSNPEQAHRAWRGTFRGALSKALGIALPELNLRKNTKGTTAYAKAFEEIHRALAPETNDLFFVTGALVALEIMIAMEYGRVEKGLKTDFKGRMLPKEMLYVTNHATHDWTHYDDLLKPLVRMVDVMGDEKSYALRRIVNGAQMMAKGKREVFLSVQRSLQRKKS